MSLSVLILNRKKDLNTLKSFTEKIETEISDVQFVCLSKNIIRDNKIKFIYDDLISNSLKNGSRFLNNDYTVIVDDEYLDITSIKSISDIYTDISNYNGDLCFNFPSNDKCGFKDLQVLKSLKEIPSIYNMIIKTSVLKEFLSQRFLSNEIFITNLLISDLNIINTDRIILDKKFNISDKKNLYENLLEYFNTLNSSQIDIVKDFFNHIYINDKIDFVLLYDNNLSKIYTSNLKKVYKGYDTLLEQVENINKMCSSFVGLIYIIKSAYSNIDEKITKIPNVVVIQDADIIPKDYLPCFNDNTREIFLKDILCLSNQFIYSKGINYIRSEVKKSDFFQNDLPLYEKDISINSHQHLLPLDKEKMNKCFDILYPYIYEYISQYESSKNYNIFVYVLYFINWEFYANSLNIYGGIDLKKFTNKLSVLIDNNSYKIIHFYKETEEMPIPKVNFSNNVFYTENSKNEKKESKKTVEPKKTIIENKTVNATANKAPKLSIIVPCYNSAPYIEKCLTSIANQTLKDFECIVIDDGSTDKTYKECLKFENDKRFRIITKKNTGVSDTRNLGIKLSRGTWIGFVDSDDWISPERYELCIKKAEEKEVDIVKCTIEFNKNNKKTYWRVKEGLYDVKDKLILSSLAYDNSGCHSGLYKAKLIKDNNIHFRGCDFGEDLIFNAECFCIAGKLYNYDNALYHYIQRGQSLSTSEMKRGGYTKVLNAFDACCRHLRNFENFKYFESIFKNNFYNRPSMKKLRENSIDYLVPYVDSSDKNWLKLYNQYADKKINEETNGMNRFRDELNLFQYQLRGLDKFMPWIDVVHIIVQSESQIPKWIDRNKVHIVYHEDFVPKEYLPTFNSSCIEMFLHNIEGLSEKFIYGNDDYLYVAKINKDIFFRDNKICNIFEEKDIYYKDENTIPVWKQIFMNSYKIVNGKYYSDKKFVVQPHIEAPYFKSILKEFFEKYKDTILKNSTSRFRTKDNLNQYMYTFYTDKLGRVIKESHSRRITDTTYNIETIVKYIASTYSKAPVRTIVINDNGSFSKESKNRLYQALNLVLGNKSFYEI